MVTSVRPARKIASGPSTVTLTDAAQLWDAGARHIKTKTMNKP
jgi:hypothetical protein